MRFLWVGGLGGGVAKLRLRRRACSLIYRVLRATATIRDACKIQCCDGLARWWWLFGGGSWVTGNEGSGLPGMRGLDNGEWGVWVTGNRDGLREGGG